MTPKHSQILFILLPTQFNSLGQFKTTSKMWITSWFIVHSQCPASCVEAKMRAPRPSAVARIIGHWRAAPAFSINKNIDAQLMESQFFGIQPQLPRFIEVNLRANGGRCDRCINNAVHTKIVGRHGCVLHVLPCLAREAGKPPLISYGKSATGTCNARRTKQTHT